MHTDKRSIRGEACRSCCTKMTSAVVVFIVFPMLLPFVGSVGVCPIDYMEHAGMCVNVLITPILNTWHQTQRKCLDQKAGMLMVKSRFEWETIVIEAAMHFQNIPAGVWLGMNFSKSEDKYLWYDGAEHSPTMDWNLWGPDETEHRPSADKCVLIERTGEEENPYEWILVDCDNRHMMGIGICVVEKGSYPDGTEWGLFALSMIAIGIVLGLLAVRWVIKRIRRNKQSKYLS